MFHSRTIADRWLIGGMNHYVNYSQKQVNHTSRDEGQNLSTTTIIFIFSSASSESNERRT